jgi:FkbH-like protein
VAECVRLVIWDLDDTFWKGTVTEEGFVYDKTTHDIVIQLAERGIVSSICSKNDLNEIRDILTETEIWNYFVLPSINWEPKGRRIQTLIETVGLRPATVLFIDDNPTNLEEAKHLLPDLQTAGPEFIPQILGSELFVGKDDRSLSRLKQYRLIQLRQEDAEAGDGWNADFLRGCNITVEIDFNVADHLDRAIELVNRTNQLNFTKLRLPEEPARARDEFKMLLDKQFIQAGIIHVRDKYGDHGYCGLYVMDRVGKLRRLLHFCFSCRILNMGVEQWVYRLLGRPMLCAVGEVLSDVFDETTEVDWITHHVPLGGETVAREGRSLPPVFARGGCDLAAVTHYFSLHSPEVVTEYNIIRAGIAIRIDHSQLLRHAIEGTAPEAQEALTALGYEPEDLSTECFASRPYNGIRIFSCWADADIPLYRHKTTDLVVPFWLVGAGSRDLTVLPEGELFALAGTPAAQDAVRYFRQNFVYAGFLDKAGLKQNLDGAFRTVSPTETIYVILANERHKVTTNGSHLHRRHVQLNGWLREIASEYPNVRLVDIAGVIEGDHELHDVNHFNRMVYYRLYEVIYKDVQQARADSQANAAAVSEAAE